MKIKIAELDARGVNWVVLHRVKNESEWFEVVTDGNARVYKTKATAFTAFHTTVRRLLKSAMAED